MKDQFKTTATLDSFIKVLMSHLDIPTRHDINRLHTRLDRLEQLLYSGKTGQNRPAGGHSKRNASGIVLDIIANYPDGTDFKTIRAATGFNDKKLRNIIFRLDKLKKIVRVKRGIYTVA